MASSFETVPCSSKIKSHGRGKRPIKSYNPYSENKSSFKAAFLYLCLLLQWFTPQVKTNNIYSIVYLTSITLKSPHKLKRPAPQKNFFINCFSFHLQLFKVRGLQWNMMNISIRKITLFHTSFASHKQVFPLS